MRRPPAGVLIQGMGGVGKTTLAAGFLRWLAATEGLGEGGFWFSFEEIRNAEHPINRMLEALFPLQAMAADMVEKLEALVKVFRERRHVIVWDNFETVRGIESSALTARVSEADQDLFRRFLESCGAGRRKS